MENEIENEIKKCNICMEEIIPYKNNLITLICDPKHYFCKTCITDWFIHLKKNKYKLMYNPENEFKERMCPICRRDGGLLPLFSQNDYIPSIHQKKLYREPRKKKRGPDNNESEPIQKQRCQHILKNGNQCSRFSPNNNESDPRCYQHIQLKKAVGNGNGYLEMMKSEEMMSELNNEWIRLIYVLDEIFEEMEKGRSLEDLFPSEEERSEFVKMIEGMKEDIKKHPNEQFKEMMTNFLNENF